MIKISIVHATWFAMFVIPATTACKQKTENHTKSVEADDSSQAAVNQESTSFVGQQLRGTKNPDTDFVKISGKTKGTLEVTFAHGKITDPHAMIRCAKSYESSINDGGMLLKGETSCFQTTNKAHNTKYRYPSFLFFKGEKLVRAAYTCTTWNNLTGRSGLCSQNGMAGDFLMSTASRTYK